MSARPFRLSLLGIFMLLTTAFNRCNPLGPVESASKNVENGATQLADGLKKLSEIDPAGIKKLLNENSELRKVAEELRGKLNDVESPAVVAVTPTSSLMFEITGYRG